MYFMSINKLKPGVDHAQFNKAIAAHREWAKKQLAAGVLGAKGDKSLAPFSFWTEHKKSFSFIKNYGIIF
jgi:hypothetical protein